MLYALFLVYLYLYQVQTFSILDENLPRLNFSDKSLPSIMDEIEKFLENITNEAEADVNNVFEEFKNISLDYLKYQEDDIHEEIKKIDEIINDMNPDNKTNIANCLKMKRDKIIKLAKKSVINSIKCVTDKITAAQNIAKQIKADIQKTFGEVKILRAKFKNCKTLSCKTKIVLQCIALKTILPIKIAQQVLRAVQLINSLQADIPVCLSNVLLKFLSDSTVIVVSFAECLIP